MKIFANLARTSSLFLMLAHPPRLALAAEPRGASSPIRGANNVDNDMGIPKGSSYNESHDLLTPMPERQLRMGSRGCRETTDDIWSGPQYGCTGDLQGPREAVSFAPTAECLDGGAACCNTRENRDRCRVACLQQAAGREGCCAYNAPRVAGSTTSGSAANGPSGCTFFPKGAAAPSSGAGTWGVDIAPVCIRQTTDPNWSGPQDGCASSLNLREVVSFTPTGDCTVNQDAACCNTQENRERCRVACVAHAGGRGGCCAYNAPLVADDTGVGTAANGPLGCTYYPEGTVTASGGPGTWGYQV